jgi:hypothetical protein
MSSSKKTSSASSRQARRRKCPECNDLDPRDHRYSAYSDSLRSQKGSKHNVRLSLSIDILKLSRQDNKKCRFCDVIARALDSLAEDWRKKRPPITLDLAWGKPIRLTVGSALPAKSAILEIYSPNGKSYSMPN